MSNLVRNPKDRVSHYEAHLKATVMILNFRTDRSGQTVQTQIRLYVFDKIPSGLASLFEFKVNYSKVSCVRKFRNFMVHYRSISIFIKLFIY